MSEGNGTISQCKARTWPVPLTHIENREERLRIRGQALGRVVEIVSVDDVVEALVLIADARVGGEEQQKRERKKDDECRDDHQESSHVLDVLDQHVDEPVNPINAAIIPL